MLNDIIELINTSAPGDPANKLYNESGAISFGGQTLQPSTHVDNSNGNPNIADGAFTVNASVTLATWETVGPTGSGADNTWTALDSVPAGVSWVEIRAYLTAQNGPGSTTPNLVLYARKNGSSSPISASNRISQIWGRTDGGGNANGSSVSTHKIPVDSNVVFDVHWTNSPAWSSPGVQLYLIGYGY